MTNKQLFGTFFPPLPPSNENDSKWTEEKRSDHVITKAQRVNGFAPFDRKRNRSARFKTISWKKKNKKKEKKKFERPFQLSRVIHLVAFLTINPPPGARKKLSDGQQLKFVPVFTGETINERHCSRLFFATCVVRGWWFCKWRDWARLVIWITLDPFLFSPSFCSL